MNEKEIAEVKVNSACRNSSIYPMTNEDELKNEIHNAVVSSIKKMKFKTNGDIHHKFIERRTKLHL